MASWWCRRRRTYILVGIIVHHLNYESMIGSRSLGLLVRPIIFCMRLVEEPHWEMTREILHPIPYGVKSPRIRSVLEVGNLDWAFRRLWVLTPEWSKPGGAITQTFRGMRLWYGQRFFSFLCRFSLQVTCLKDQICKVDDQSLLDHRKCFGFAYDPYLHY